MPYYKDTNNILHFLDDSKYEYLLPVGCIEITEEEAQLLQAEKLPAPIVDIIPQEVSKAQGIAAMIAAELWPQVKQCFAQDASEDERDLFAATTVFNRQSPLLKKIQAQLELTDEQVDQLFIDASKVIV